MAKSDQAFSVTFWGTRGSIATAGPDTVKYGGNTSCLEVMCGQRRLIFDAGTGLRALGKKIASDLDQDIDLFLTHTHLDHIIGLPFFVPFHIPGHISRLWAGHLLPDRTLKETLSGMMQAPLFPVPPETFRGKVECNDFTVGETLRPSEEIEIRTGPLNHPNGATGYRVNFQGQSICYITDTEHFPMGQDPSVVALCKGADMMIYDASYTDEEYPRFRGFGHSTWEEALRVADAADVKTAVLFHHDPSHTDAIMDDIADAAEKARPGTIVAREGMTLSP